MRPAAEAAGAAMCHAIWLGLGQTQLINAPDCPAGKYAESAMQTIAIAAPSPVPFQMGGAEKSFIALRQALCDLPGVWAEIIKLPCREDDLPGLLDAYESFNRLDLRHFDRIITCKYPAWMISHPCHTVYMYHKLRGLYDHYPLPVAGDSLLNLPSSLADVRSFLHKKDAGRDDLPEFFSLCRRALKQKSVPSSVFALPGPLSRAIVHFLDRIALAPGQISRYFALSRTVAERDEYFPAEAAVEILYMPPPQESAAGLAGPGNDYSAYFFTASRLSPAKRMGMLVRAMAEVKADIGLKIAGTGSELHYLRRLAAGDKRIEFLGHVPEEKLAALYAGALAVPFVPEAEDYGLITVEAMRAGKPVITVWDSGGPAELVQDGINGFVTEPNAGSLGSAMNRLAQNPALAHSLGAAAQRSVEHLRWENVAAALSGASAPIAVVAAPFAADAEGAGGPRRLWHFCQELSRHFQVRLVAMGPIEQESRSKTDINSRWSQLLLPWPAEAAAAAKAFAGQGMNGDDAVLVSHAADDPLLLAALQEAGQDAVCAICAHPWLYDAVDRALPGLPVIYDAYNCEADLKREILGEVRAAPLVDMELRLCRAACLVYACSEGDMNRLQVLHNAPPERFIILPNGCDIPVLREDRASLRSRLPYGEVKLALFLGSDHKPNVDGALDLASVARAVPGVHFLIAGSVCHAPALTQAQLPANMHLLGSVSEKVKNLLLAACDMALNPVTAGSGTNLKTVEYMANGVPVISTPCGMRGIAANMTAMTHICDLQDFPEAIQRLLLSPPGENQLADMARAVQSACSWEAVLAPLCPTLSSRLSHAVDH